MNFVYDFFNHILPMPGTNAWVILVDVFTAIANNFLLVCMAVYGLVLVRRVWRTLAAIPQPERAAQRAPLVKRTVKRFAVFYLVWWVVFSINSYRSDAMARRGASECERITSPEYKDYYVIECTVRGNQFGRRSLIRLYASEKNELLSEKFVYNAEGELEWRNTRSNEQGFDETSKPYIVLSGSLEGIGTYGVSIELPPPWWEQLLAKLP